ncbi:glycosyltransferase [Leuconostoc rapi]|uniref:glycosyltransferase n=1 Tax=Leuconostoc rapi TaxID=1406906 RepID=UPI001957ABED|nr:glycosyltransferase [Leuconostoc rapi]
MYFFVNKGMGHGNSGVEHAQFYRAAQFRDKNLPFKMIFTDHLPRLHQHMKEWHIAEHEVIGVYDYLLSDDPDKYLRDGNTTMHNFDEEVLWDNTNTQRIIKRQTTGNYIETIQRRKRYDKEKQVYQVEDDRVILENKEHQVSWHYRNEPSRGDQMTNIRVDNFREKDYLFTTFEELLDFFFSDIQHRFENNVYLIDRGTENEEAIIRIKQQDYTLKIVDVVHADHFVTWYQGHPLWNNYYQYMFDHLADVDLIVVATKLQRQAMLSQLKDIGVNNLSRKIVAIPVGGVADVSEPQKWLGGAMKFVTASRLHSEKHITHIIQAISQLRQAGLDATLAIYGAGIEESALITLINTLNLSPFVMLKGLSQNMRLDMQAYDVFVSASYSEGFGLTYIDAISNALPIATYANLYGAQELVYDGVNGYLAQFSRNPADEQINISQLAAAMRHTFETYNQLSIGAHDVAMQFQNDSIANQWQKVMVNL